MPRTPPALIDPLLAISSNLRPRDYVLAHLLDEHDILSVEQIKAILFTSPHTCSHRLDELRRMRFIVSSSNLCADGSRRKFWLPGLLSTRYVSIATHEPEPTRKALQDRQARAAVRRDRDDIAAANWFFLDLIAHSRKHLGSNLAR